VQKEKEIINAIQALNESDDVRVIIIMSKADGFCSGLYLMDFMSLGLIGGMAKDTYFFHDKARPLFDCRNVMEECLKPIIAAVHGVCIGGGLDIISACDIRLCTEDTTFALREAALGFIADMGVLQRLPHIIGQGYTREMAYTARNFSAHEVDRMGFMNNIYPDKETLFAEAKKLAGRDRRKPTDGGHGNERSYQLQPDSFYLRWDVQSYREKLVIHDLEGPPGGRNGFC